MVHRIKILINALSGVAIRLWFNLAGFQVKNGLNTDPRDKELIVSLTSYGRRTRVLLKFVLVSLLRQRCKPDRIIVWLDQNQWSNHNLPRYLLQLSQCGVEFKFCEDLRSYTKLVPSLSAFPNAIIITVDDDLFYSSTLVEDLYRSYIALPTKIHTAIAHRPKRDINEKLLPYNDWEKNTSNTNSTEIFPTGCGGCLYPPNSLFSDVLKSELFLALCPTADDVWFWVMAKLQQTQHVLVKSNSYVILDLFYEYTHKNAGLNHQNVNENANDKQIRQVLDYYKIN